jgi:membrane-associated protease RseP (regulator of RpoE activity)
VTDVSNLPLNQPEPSLLPPDARRRRGKDRVWLHVLLLLITFVTTTMIGTLHYASFASNFGMRQVRLTTGLLWYGLPYSVTILSILGAHEMGHYLACRYYRVSATLPFFLPTPPFPPFMTGTFGAVIRIRQPILWKKALFDIGIAGPIAGFLVAVPALLLGVWWSNVMPVPPNMEGYSLGEPLLFKAASWLVWGKPPVPFEVNMHPISFAAWFGLLATAFNLFPIAQLDGGHIAYAMFGRRATYITYAGLATAFALCTYSTSWYLWTALIIAMLYIAGAKHPPVLDEDVPLDPARRWLALFALVMFVLCFTPAPIEPLELLRH